MVLCYEFVEVQIFDSTNCLRAGWNLNRSKQLCCLMCYRIALCIDGHQRFTTNKRQLLGKEAIKQRHLRLLGYEVVQVRTSSPHLCDLSVLVL